MDAYANVPAVDYTSRDFPSLRTDLIKAVQARIPNWAANNPADFGMALVEAFAYVGDLAQYYTDRVGNEAFLTTATQRQSLLDIAAMLGYSPANPIPAYTPSVTVYNPTAAPIEISNGALFSVNALTPSGMRTLTYEAILPLLGTAQLERLTIPAAGSGGPGTAVIAAIEGRSVSFEDLGISNGTADQEFRVTSSPISEGTLEVLVGVSGSTNVVTGQPVYGTLRYGEIIWSTGPDRYIRVIGYSDAGPHSKIFFQRTDIDGSTTIRFGDGVNGVIPQRDRKIYVSYRLGGGAVGNLPAGTQLTGPGSLYAVFNSPAAGGVDAESDASIRRNAASTFRSRNRAVTKRDFADLALSVPGVAKSVSRADAYSSVAVHIAPMATSNEPAPGFNGYMVTNRASTGTNHKLTIPGIPLYPDPVGQIITVQGVGTGWDTDAASPTYTITAVDSTDPDNPIVSYTATTTQTQAAIASTGVVTLGQHITFTSLQREVKTLLESRATIGCVVTVSPVAYVHAQVEVTIYAEPNSRWSVARGAAKTVLLDLFDFQSLQPGQPIRYQDIVIGLASQPDIGWAEVNVLKRTDGSSPLEVNELQPGPGEILRLLEGNIAINFGGDIGINDLQ